MTPTLDAALLCSSRAGSDLGRESGVLLSDQYCNAERGFEPGSSSECLLEFDLRSKTLGHHGW